MYQNPAITDLKVLQKSLKKEFLFVFWHPALSISILRVKDMSKNGH